MSPTEASGLSQLLGAWQRPHDPAAWIALGLSGYLALRAITARPLRPGASDRPVSRKRFLTVGGFAAAFLSLGYIAYYLRGGPRIIDATSYFLQGRALSHGMLSWTVPEVSANFRGRFLLFQEPDHLAGIFPPGYPLLLAIGFLVGAPMVIGPLLAAALVVATYFLARELAKGHPDEETIARLAAALGVACVALRYHTADTMAHGAAGLAVTIGLAAALAARRTRDARLFALVGLAVGYVVCTRPVSAVPLGAVVLALAFGAAERPRALAWSALAAVPGVLFLLAANRAATGSALGSPQLLYYATSDGPPGCFRYGFGAHIGCLFEHKDFVAARLPHGYGLVEAILVTARRLRMHTTDFANLEPLFVLVLVAARKATRPVLIALTVVVGQVLAYAPFYFDGNYPGGGARLFADVLPIEHALGAVALARILPSVAYVRRGFALLALSALGFAVHAASEHQALADRDGGRPMFEPDKLREANVQHGLVFFETDHGFNLAHDPSVLPSHGVVAARLRGDDHDRLLHARLGHPIAHVYKQRTAAEGPELSKFPIQGGLADPAWRFESEADWPPIAQSMGWAEPAWATTTCASAGRVLTVRVAAQSARASVTIELPIPRAAVWRIRPNVLARGTGAEAELTLAPPNQKEVLRWTFRDGPGTARCEALPPQTAELAPPAALLTISTNQEISLDYVTIEVEKASH